VIRRRDPLERPEALIRRVYAYVAYRIGDGPDAEDITSETFERALRYRESYDDSRGEPVGWLIGIARRCIADGFARREPTIADPPDVIDARDVEDEAVRRLAVGAAVGRLEVGDRELIALRYGADMTARQIGEVLEMNTNAVEVALHRALSRLRSLVEREDGSEVNAEPQRSAQG
jgi:RNA polymerase sigma factor (sigma-70 family)